MQCIIQTKIQTHFVSSHMFTWVNKTKFAINQVTTMPVSYPIVFTTNFISYYFYMLMDYNPWFSFTVFTIYAHVTASARGFPRVIYDGYAFGMKAKTCNDPQQVTRWVCTGSESITRKRCCASIQTKQINGFTMMSERSCKHNCTKLNEPTHDNQSHWRFWNSQFDWVESILMFNKLWNLF